MNFEFEFSLLFDVTYFFQVSKLRKSIMADELWISFSLTVLYVFSLDFDVKVHVKASG